VAFSWDSSANQYRIYFNGVQQATTRGNAPHHTQVFSRSQMLRLGKDNNSASFGGMLDEFTIYSGAISALEIQAIYEAGPAGKVLQHPPTAIAGGPYTVQAGGSVTLDGSASTDPDNNIVTYEWDFDYDNSTFNIDAAGVQPVFDASALTNAETRTIALRVTDGGGLSHIATTTLNVLGAVSRWDFTAGSGTVAADSVGSNDGTLVNGPMWGAGISDGALTFDGVDDYVHVPDSDSLDITGALTMESWVMMQVIDNNYETFIWKTDSGISATRDYSLGRIRNDGSGASWAGKFYSTILTTAGRTEVESATRPVAGVWYHVVSTFDGASHNLYVNGVLESQQAWSGTILTSSEPLLLGRTSISTALNSLHGSMEEAAVFNTALSATQIAERYAQFNQQPDANAGGPYSVLAGGSVTLNGSASTDPDNNIATYEWDFDYDNSTFDVHATGVAPVFDASALTNAETKTIALRVTDQGGLSHIATTTLTVRGLVAQWSFNEGTGSVAGDSVDGLNGVINGNANWVQGTYGSALYLDGNDTVDVPHSNVLNVATDLTLEAWVRFDSVDNNYEAIVTKTSNSSGNNWESYALMRNRTGDLSESWMGRLSFNLETTAGRYAVRSTIVPVANQWYYLVGTYDGTVQKLYINGQLDSQIVHGGSVISSTQPLWIGHHPYPFDAYYLQGGVDEIAVYNRARSAAEILAGYQGVNAAPTAVPGGAYSVDEESSVRLDGTGSTDPNNNIVSYEWDYDYDGSTFNVDATGEQPVFSAAAIDGPATRTIALRVIDAGGLVSPVVTTTVQIDNVAPIIALSGNSTVTEGAPFTLTLGDVTDPGDDTVTEYIVNWGDGTSDTYTQPGPVTHTYQDGFSLPGQPQFSVSTTVVEDTFISDLGDSWNANSTHGSDGNLWAINQFVGNPTLTCRPMFRFDLSDWQNQTVTGDAIFRVYVNGPDNSTYYQSQARTVYLQQILSPWDDDTVTWNTRPGSTTIGSPISIVYTGEDHWVQWTIPQSVIQGWLDDPSTNYGVMINNELPDAFLYDLTFSSLEKGDGNPAELSFTVNAPRQITVDLVDEDGLHLDAGRFDISVENAPPTAVPGGPYNVIEGASTVLDGTASFDPGNDIVRYEWDFDFDGTNFDVDATGATPLLDAAALDGPTSRVISLRVTDSSGAWDQMETTLAVTNTAPVVVAGGTLTANEGATVQLSGAGLTDAGLSDNHSVVINWGDGSDVEVGTITPGA
ncbi:MAG: DNRLRE domain-containing protein, partial [Planctomycetaceae bacterium]|nr:DNRLRE domain-containing protein [Planctomycetaceae bacterium]